MRATNQLTQPVHQPSPHLHTVYSQSQPYFTCSTNHKLTHPRQLFITHHLIFSPTPLLFITSSTSLQAVYGKQQPISQHISSIHRLLQPSTRYYLSLHHLSFSSPPLLLKQSTANTNLISQQISQHATNLLQPSIRHHLLSFSSSSLFIISSSFKTVYGEYNRISHHKLATQHTTSLLHSSITHHRLSFKTVYAHHQPYFTTRALRKNRG